VIPHITKGADLRGLMTYLVSTKESENPRHNQHENPHVIGGDGFLQSWHGHDELGRQDAADIAAYLDEPRRAYGVQMMTKQWRQDPETGAREPVLGDDGRQAWRDVNVWHCSLSLPAGEVLSAEQWEQVTREFADGMNLTDAGGHAPARWVAIHHGTSRGGNDHVHIAASMVREDGTRWEGRFRDWPTSQRVCRELEVRHGLTRVEGAEHGTATLGATPPELAQQQRSGAPTIQREDLAQRVRAAAVASASEAEWLRRVQADVVVRPRFAEGTTDVVAGYRAALRGQDSLRFYGGGQLGRDLSLPRLRELWPEPSIEQADEAAAEWQAAFRGRRTGVVGREQRDLPPTAPDAARRSLSAFADRLATVPVSDRVAWSVAAREMSGALSAWADVDGPNAAALRQAASVIGRTAQDRRPGAAAAQRGPDSAVATALVFMASRGGDKPTVAAVALMAQLVRAASALADYHRASRNAREAEAVRVQVQQLVAMKWTGYGSEPVDSRKVQAPAGKRQPKQPTRPGPALALPRELDHRPQVAARYHQAKEDRDGGR